VCAAVVYAAMWVGFRLHWFDSIDGGSIDAMRRYGLAHPGWVRFWDVFCTVLGPDGFRVLGVVAIVFAALRRNVRVILFLLASIGLTGVLTESAKRLAGRPRPPGALASATSLAFPSGHAVAVMTGVLVLLTVAAGLLHGASRTTAVAVGALAVFAVGFGRVAVTVHYPTDVVAGWALGYLWFVVCLAVFRPRVTRASVERLRDEL
jgi:membrane-associated phospholipid phosphatase